jgi:hypothetical protein
LAAHTEFHEHKLVPHKERAEFGLLQHEDIIDLLLPKDAGD